MINLNEEEIKLNLIDISGKEKYTSLNLKYVKSPNAIVICFDINDRNSFDKVSF